jgi:glycosyltransferase involved in cell wall biosynthesis
MPKVSVIVPNYNHARFLRQRLDSIFHQIFQDFEVIILDDCSTDDSVNVIKEYESKRNNIQIILNTINSGSTFLQWQKGIAQAKGEWIWIAESDDFAHPMFLETMLQYSDSPNLGVIACESHIVDENGVVTGNTKSWTNRNEAYYGKAKNGLEFCANELVITNLIPNASAVLFKNSSRLKEINYTISKKFGDWILWFGLLLKSDVLFVNKDLNNFRKHGQNVTPTGQNYKLYKREVLDVLIGFAKSLEAENCKVSLLPQSMTNWIFKDTIWDEKIRLSRSNLLNMFYVAKVLESKKRFFVFCSKFVIIHLLRFKFLV